MNNQYYQLSTDEKGMHFYRAISDPTIELQHSLTQALNEADELRAKNQDLQSELNSLKCQSSVNRNQTQAYEAIIKGVQESLKDCFDKNEELEAEIKRLHSCISTQSRIKSQPESDLLSELTNIMRMVQVLEDIPQDKVDGAIYLIKRVLYDSICKLDPSQSWDA